MKKLFLKSLILFIVVLSMLFSMVACGGASTTEEEEDAPISEEVSGEVLTAGNMVDNVFSLSIDMEKSSNPITTTSTLNQMVGSLVYDTLFELDDNFNLTSRILSDWYYVEDSGVWVITPRDDILMHDGELLTSDDIYYSLTRIFTQGATYYQGLTDNIYCSNVSGSVYIAGDYANSLLPYRLIVPIIRNGSILEDTPVGSGPYKYAEDKSCLEKFDDYESSETLPFNKIYLQPFTDNETLLTEYESGLVDLVNNDPTGQYNMGYAGRNEKRTYCTTNFHYISFNAESKFFQYEQYRQAITYLVNRDTICEQVLDGFGSPSALFIHPNSFLFDKELNESYSYNPEKALEVLEKLGCRDMDDDGLLEYALNGGKEEIDLDFIVCSDTGTKPQAVKQIAEEMEKIGITVRVIEYSYDEYINALEEGQYDMFYAEVALTADWSLLELLKEYDEEHPDGINYTNGWYSETLESAFYDYLAAPEETRAEALATVHSLMESESMIIPVCFEKRQILSHLSTIKGLSPTQYNLFNNVENWTAYIDKE